MRKSILIGMFAVPAFWAAETKVKIEQLPPAVQAAVREQTKGATILGASKERENGRMTYEVETEQDGKSRDLTFDDKGALLEVEQEVAIDTIPAAARDAIRRKAGSGEVKKVESVTRGSVVNYEADVRTKAGKNIEISVGADGGPAR